MNHVELRRTVETDIQVAFRGVTLGRGMSLRQAKAADANLPSAHPAPGEILDDWSQVTLEELEGDCIAHLDAGGFRYYIPAFMLSVLSHYDSASMRVIGTLAGLYPKKGDGYEFQVHHYSLLDSAQKTAIARFLAALPNLIELELDDQKIVSRALRNYWGQYLP